MKYLIIAAIMVFFYSYINRPALIGGTNYYVKNGGNDASDGLTDATAWATLTKVNSVSFSSGDSVLLKAGSTFIDSLRPNTSGVNYGNYGSGDKPIITGFKTATGFTDSSHFWNVSLPDIAANINTITIDGKVMPKGRYPNTSFLTQFSISQTKIRSNTALTQNYVGGETVIYEFGFIIDVGKITAQDGGTFDTLTISPGLTYNQLTTTNYFIQNCINVLDTANEWAYFNNKLYIYSLSDPSGRVQYSTIDTLVKVHSINNLSFTGISFTGSNKIGVSMDTLSNVLFTNCTFNNNGATSAQLNKASRIKFYSDSITNSLSNGIWCRWPSDSVVLKNSYVKNIGKYAGMGLNGNSQYIGFFAWGAKDSIYNNKFDSIGYIAVHHAGDSDLVKYNYATNFCSVKEDGAAFYSNPYASITTNNGSKVKSNIAVNGIGVGGTKAAAGIYEDQFNSQVTIDSNTVSHCKNYAMLVNGGQHFNIRNNTIVNDVGMCLYIDNASALSNTTFINNTYYSTFYNGYVFNSPNMFSWGIVVPTISSDSNHIIRRIATDSVFWYGQNHIFYSTSGWQTFTGYELNSSFIPDNITSANGVLYINPTLSDSIITFSGLYIDAKGGLHNNSDTLAPFTSRLLFKADYEIVVPAGGRTYGNLIFKNQ